MQVRPPAVAGMFYPGKPEQLRQMLAELLGDARRRRLAATGGDTSFSPGKVRAVVVPHAGYIYSGSTAALAYDLLESVVDSVKHVVIVGPTHRVGIPGIALPQADALATPLGEVRLWPEGVEIASAQAQVVVSADVHAAEHSLEVQLPFVQTVLPGADVLALAAGWVDAAAVAAVLEACAIRQDTIIVISSDLSHYHSYAQAQRIDQATVRQILECDPQIDHNQACGATGVNAMSRLARDHGWQPHLLGCCNSGDTAGDKSRVVGYAAVAYDEPGGWESVGRESGARELGARELGGCELGARELGGCESAARGSADRESGGWESVDRESADDEPGDRELGGPRSVSRQAPTWGTVPNLA